MKVRRGRGGHPDTSCMTRLWNQDEVLVLDPGNSRSRSESYRQNPSPYRPSLSPLPFLLSSVLVLLLDNKVSLKERRRRFLSG